MPKYYTPGEANHVLDAIRPLVEEMIQAAQQVNDHRPELWDLAQKAAGNGGSAQLSKLIPRFDRLRELMHQLSDMGIEIKDPLTGLIDFVALKEGREVYLCWKYNEVRIQYWHELDAGFAGRQRIDWE
jgi:hypothetical protein